MASNFSGDLQLELITTGEKAGLWGTITNNNLQILELSSTGYFTVSIAAANLTLNLDAGSALGDSTATGKNLMVEVTGTLAASRTITMPVGAERIFIVKDSTTRSNNNYNYQCTKCRSRCFRYNSYTSWFNLYVLYRWYIS